MTTTLHGHTLPDLPPGLDALAEGVRHALAGECDCCGCWDSHLHEGQCSACDGRLAVAAHTAHGWPKAPSPAEALDGRVRRMLEALARRTLDPMDLDHPLPTAIALERAEDTVLDDLEALLLDMDAAARAAGRAA
jgi:hypothetical protein